MSDMRNIERENKKKQLRSNIVPMPGNRSGSQARRDRPYGRRAAGSRRI